MLIQVQYRGCLIIVLENYVLCFWNIYIQGCIRIETSSKLNLYLSKLFMRFSNTFQLKTHRTNRDELVGMIHHCNEKIEEHDDVDYWKGTKHDETPKSCTFFYSRQFKIIEVNQTKCSPKQSLCCFPQADEMLNY